MKVFVGLSGGVDSAVSAALLQKEGHEVTGVFIHIALDGYPCSADEDQLDAMRVAAHLKIPFLAIDLSEEYKKRVFEISIAEFKKGRTPNPDTLCNKEIKFGLFFDWCMNRGADYVATGHYARIVPAKPVQKNSLGATRGLFSEQVSLHVATDPDKDQSYFLWAVSEIKLRKTLFPVGSFKKLQVRKLAKKLGLPNAERKDSQGLCFLGPVSMDEMLRQELMLVPSDVLDEAGEVIGRHGGAPAYTLGQRHGFELSAHTPNTRPHFVVGKDIEFNTITVSTERYPQGVTKTEVAVVEENWIGGVEEGPCMARYRYRQKLIPAVLQRILLKKGSKRESSVMLLEPHYVPEGQSLVLYEKGAPCLPAGRCLGGGIVDKSSLL